MNHNFKKEQKERFKEIKPVMGVITVSNLSNGYVWVFSGLNTQALINRTKFVLRNGQLENISLQQDWSSQGESNFSFDVIAVLTESDSLYFDSKKELKKLEDRVVAELRAKNTLLY